MMLWIVRSNLFICLGFLAGKANVNHFHLCWLSFVNALSNCKNTTIVIFVNGCFSTAGEHNHPQSSFLHHSSSCHWTLNTRPHPAIRTLHVTVKSICLFFSPSWDHCHSHQRCICLYQSARHQELFGLCHVCHHFIGGAWASLAWDLEWGDGEYLLH